MWTVGVAVFNVGLVAVVVALLYTKRPTATVEVLAKAAEVVREKI